MKEKKQKTQSLSPREQVIMSVIWSKKHSSVYGVWEALEEIATEQGTKKIGRMTVQVQLNRLVEKGWLERKKFEGRYHYYSLKDENSSKAKVVTNLVERMFDSSISNLIRCLRGDINLNKSEIQEAKRLLEEYEDELDSDTK